MGIREGLRPVARKARVADLPDNLRTAEGSMRFMRAIAVRLLPELRFLLKSETFFEFAGIKFLCRGEDIYHTPRFTSGSS